MKKLKSDFPAPVCAAIIECRDSELPIFRTISHEGAEELRGKMIVLGWFYDQSQFYKNPWAEAKECCAGMHAEFEKVLIKSTLGQTISVKCGQYWIPFYTVK